MSSAAGPLVTAAEASALAASGKHVRFVDASWYLDKNRNGRAEYEDERLPGAVFFDIDGIKDQASTLPHMLPTESVFSSAMKNLGITNDTSIIVYGGPNCFSPARCWWTFKYFGHRDVHVLNGGMTQWKKEGRPLEQGPPAAPTPSSGYVATADSRLVLNAEQVLALLSTENQIIDARGPGRFLGKEAEPRPGVRSGHMPGALNTPFSHVLRSDDYSAFREPLEIQKNFEASGVRLGDTTLIATTCGSGVTAAVLTLGLHLLDVPLHRAPVYDGSWSEWGSRNDLPITKEP
ncbi:3-mercaptopyruvate sulfurtransferase [Achlya hypogyna]|uniref:Sulfurtransferase n=1 Tax=Achlya hypogyna TaxID=1202772 RepID=A0A1V9ZI12_ACHHY|nr:3-mercaptopyruvate sulfurtransferase [Achlya hypogyna]